VKAFQLSNGLTADGIVGDKTWAVLNAEMVKPAKTYTVTINGLTQEQVVKLRTQYPQAVVSK
jgi:peptidoglycan hydrolase-like protein with peptidoglycan-binding domain